MADNGVEFDPFNPEPDGEETKEALCRSLEMAQGFTLLFVIYGFTGQREQLLDEVAQCVPTKRIWHCPVTQEVPNLFHVFEEKVPEPAPDVVFVYGLENWLSGSVRPRSIPLLRNLNAARDAFPLVTDCPVVFFVPLFVLQAIADAAPDFFSVRSGLFNLPADPDDHRNWQGELANLDYSALQGFPTPERDARIGELHNLLSRIRSDTGGQRNRSDETFVLNQLGMAYHATGNDAEAEQYFTEALRIRRAALPPNHPDIATSLSNLGAVYEPQNRLAEAEQHHNEALRIRRAALPLNHPDIAQSLSNLAGVYARQNRLAQAELFFTEALEILRAALPPNHPNIATSLNNLAGVYVRQNRLAEAEKLSAEAVRIAKESLPDGHPDREICDRNWKRLREWMNAMEILSSANDEE
ncbi:MAG: tetratricopeptide repeat protein [Capsulimonadales bacterium]|nr:tetratricopeptide repeat protein [Capsulimonadales bacterium]